MNPTDWERVRELFAAALAQPPDLRDAYVAAHCHDDALRDAVRALIAADGVGHTLLDGGAADAVTGPLTAARLTMLSGPRIGPYRVVRPIGIGGMALHEWVLQTRTFQRTHLGKDDGTTGPDDDFAARGYENIGAWILGRNMFGPVRGPWQDDGWKGWWGDEPPYHCPVFVLTHHPRAPIEMKGGTTFHFVTDGIHAALERAKAAAKGKDVRIGGGVATIQQYLRARLIDELHLAFRPILMGTGENLFAGIDLAELGYRAKRHVATDLAVHVVIEKTA